MYGSQTPMQDGSRTPLYGSMTPRGDHGGGMTPSQSAWDPSSATPNHEKQFDYGVDFDSPSPVSRSDDDDNDNLPSAVKVTTTSLPR